MAIKRTAELSSLIASGVANSIIPRWEYDLQEMMKTLCFST